VPFFVAIGLKFFVLFFVPFAGNSVFDFVSFSLVFILHIYERSYSSGEKGGCLVDN